MMKIKVIIIIMILLFTSVVVAVNEYPPLYDTQAFTAYDTLTFGGKLDIGMFSPTVAVNGSAGVEETNATLFGYLINNLSNDTTCWFQASKHDSDFTTPTVNVSVGIIAQDTNFTQNMISLENGTFYYFRTRANNTLGWNNSVSNLYFLTKPQPASGMALSSVDSGFNVTWTQGDGSNLSYLVVNTTHVPDSRTDGTNIYNGTNPYYEHTGLTSGTTYYYRVWENSSWGSPVLGQWSDGNTNTSDTYQGFTPYDTLTFGGKLNVTAGSPTLSNEQPTNASTEVIMYPWTNITVSDGQGDYFNVTWYTNASGSWVTYGYNDTVTDETFRQRATWANTSATEYWWRVCANDSDGNWINETYYFTLDTYTWGNWSSWWEFNYTCCSPTNLAASPYNKTIINLTWTTCGDGADTNYLVVNESGWTSYPLTPSNGTMIYNGTESSYNHTGLVNGTAFYYTIWGYNNTNNNYSLVNDTASATTQGDFTICCSYPTNATGNIDRPPTNFSTRINGTNLDIYYYIYNITAHPDVWVETSNWSGGGNARYEVINLISGGNLWIWGNTNYTWYVNVTDGNVWINETFNYTTKGSRYDVDNSNDVIATDVSIDWSYRSGAQGYDGIFDVDESGDVTATDCSIIWSNRT